MFVAVVLETADEITYFRLAVIHDSRDFHTKQLMLGEQKRNVFEAALFSTNGVRMRRQNRIDEFGTDGARKRK